MSPWNHPFLPPPCFEAQAATFSSFLPKLQSNVAQLRLYHDCAVVKQWSAAGATLPLPPPPSPKMGSAAGTVLLRPPPPQALKWEVQLGWHHRFLLFLPPQAPKWWSTSETIPTLPSPSLLAQWGEEGIPMPILMVEQFGGRGQVLHGGVQASHGGITLPCAPVATHLDQCGNQMLSSNFFFFKKKVCFIQISAYSIILAPKNL